MSLVERSGEKVARYVSRRLFLHRTAQGVFAVAAAWAANLLHPLEAFASCPYGTENTCTCTPPNGVWCTDSHPGGCNSDGTCNQSICQPWKHNYTSTGCWCTDVCCQPNNTAGYWVCCDCTCGSPVACGCHAFFRTSQC